MECIPVHVTHHPASTCPGCKLVLDATSDGLFHNGVPVPGDLTLCTECGTLLLFNPDMALRQLTFDEWGALDYDIQLACTVARRALSLNTILFAEWRYDVTSILKKLKTRSD